MLDIHERELVGERIEAIKQRLYELSLGDLELRQRCAQLRVMVAELRKLRIQTEDEEGNQGEG